MSEIGVGKPTFEELTQDGVESTDPAHLRWRDEKVRAAIRQADAHPDKRTPLREMWKILGLES